MSKPAGKCVFCGGSGLTKGHIWPEWMGDVLISEATHHVQTVGELKTFTPKMRRPAYKQRMRQGHAGSRKLRNTCANCNSGWMSLIESSAKPFAIPLMRGEPYLLTTIGQRFLSALLCLITIRVEFSDMATQAVPPSDREWFKEKFEPSSNWQIWIAKYADDDPEKHWCYHHGFVIVSSPDENAGPYMCNTQATTLVIGRLCAHIFSATDWPDFDGYEGVTLSRIWPPAQLEIDTRFLSGLSGRAVLSLAEALARETPPVPSS
jgi:hypothetical protein